MRDSHTRRLYVVRRFDVISYNLWLHNKFRQITRRHSNSNEYITIFCIVTFYGAPVGNFDALGWLFFMVTFCASFYRNKSPRENFKRAVERRLFSEIIEKRLTFVRSNLSDIGL